MQVHRFALGRHEVAKLLDLFQQFHDAPAFGNDEIGQFKITFGQVHRQKLCRAGDPGQRVLDLMGQHLGHADGGFGGGFHAVILGDAPGQFARGDHQNHLPRPAHQWRNLQAALQRRALHRAHIHVIHEQRRALQPRTGKSGLKRVVHRDQLPDRLANRGAGRGIEETFGGRVQIRDPVVGADDKGRHRQRGPNLPLRYLGPHAATGG